MLPLERVKYRHRSRGYWLTRADALCPEVGAHIREVFDADELLSQLRAVQGIVTLLEKHPRHRARAACRRAAYFGNHTYIGLRDILRKGLDLEPMPDDRAVSMGRLEQPRFARPVQEILFVGGTP